jgi:hypothetical protein
MDKTEPENWSLVKSYNGEFCLFYGLKKPKEKSYSL